MVGFGETDGKNITICNHSERSCYFCKKCTKIVVQKNSIFEKTKLKAMENKVYYFFIKK